MKPLNLALIGRIKAIITGLGLGLAILLSANWWNIYRGHVPECLHSRCAADFVTFYAEGKLAWDDSRSLYDLDKQLAYQNHIVPSERVLPFVYPPITVAFLAPLALLPFSTAFLLMTFVNLMLIATSLRLMIRGFQLSTDQAHWLLLFSVCNFGVQAVVFNGQTSAIVLYFLTRHILAQRQAEAHGSGLWAGLLSVKPQFLPLPHFVLMLRGQWRQLFIASSVSAVLITGGFLWIGVEASTQYFQLAHRMVNTDSDWWNEWRAMHNWRALAAYWLPESWQAPAWWAGTILVIAVLAWINRRPMTNYANFAISWIANCLGLLLVLPHLFTHDLSLLIVPCALLVSLQEQQVSPVLGISLITLANLPAINYLVPTTMASVLVILFIGSLYMFATNESGHRARGTELPFRI